MNTFTILSANSRCRTREGQWDYTLLRNIIAYYHEDYQGGQGRYHVLGSVENLICTFKNDITSYPDFILDNAMRTLNHILVSDLPVILRDSQLPSLRVCVIPRAKRENSYRPNQKLFRQTIQLMVQESQGLEDGTMDIIRHTDTVTTHLDRIGRGGNGCRPYVGITRDTCTISDNVVGKDILLIDDLYTMTVNIDEDCIQALYDKGARSVRFYSIGKTLFRH